MTPTILGHWKRKLGRESGHISEWLGFDHFESCWLEKEGKIENVEREKNEEDRKRNGGVVSITKEHFFILFLKLIHSISGHISQPMLPRAWIISVCGIGIGIGIWYSTCS